MTLHAQLHHLWRFKFDMRHTPCSTRHGPENIWLCEKDDDETSHHYVTFDPERWPKDDAGKPAAGYSWQMLERSSKQDGIKLECKMTASTEDVNCLINCNLFFHDGNQLIGRNESNGDLDLVTLTLEDTYVLVDQHLDIENPRRWWMTIESKRLRVMEDSIQLRKNRPCLLGRFWASVLELVSEGEPEGDERCTWRMHSEEEPLQLIWKPEGDE